MEYAPSGISLSFEVTYDRSDLFVGMSVYDNSGSSPVLVAGPMPMHNWAGYSYQAKFLASPNLSYLIFKAVYIDEDLTTLDNEYSQGTESIVAEPLPQDDGGGVGCQVVGYVDNNNTIIGLVNC